MNTAELQAKIDAANAKLGESQRLTQEAARLQAEAVEAKQMLEYERSQEKVRAAMKDVGERLAVLRERADEINELSEALKAKLLEFSELGAECNRIGQSQLQREFIHVNYDPVGSLPGLFWTSGETSSIHVDTRENIRQSLSGSQGMRNRELYGERVAKLANIGA